MSRAMFGLFAGHVTCLAGALPPSDQSGEPYLPNEGNKAEDYGGNYGGSGSGRGRRVPRWRDLRDVILFFSGLLGVAHQTLVAPSPNPSLLVLFAAMMGLTAFLRQDEKKLGGSDGGKSGGSPRG
jgi:hypothetical protein